VKVIYLPREIESTLSFKEIFFKKNFPLFQMFISYPTIVQPYLNKMNRIAEESLSVVKHFGDVFSLVSCVCVAMFIPNKI
jgi:hypothetical protein